MDDAAILAAMPENMNSLGYEGPVPQPTPAVPQVTDEASYAAVPGGSTYLDPQGQKRTKAWNVASEADYEKVPEGTSYIDPEGVQRTKPKYEGLNFTTQTLYDMALTDKEKRKILEKGYSGKIKDDYKNEPYVEDDEGVLRKPSRGDFVGKRGAAAITAAAAPTTGAVLGALGGGAVGTAVPIVGNVAGVAAGGAAGGMLGQWMNDIILQLSGVYDRSPEGDTAHTNNMLMAGATGAMGAGVGRGISTVVPSLKAGVSAAGAAAPRMAASFLGADPAATTLARELAEKGVQVPPSAWAKEAPHLQNVVEVFDPAFRTQAPLLESATKHYEKSAGQLLDDLGVPPFEGGVKPRSIVNPTADVPTQQAGEAIMARTIAESQAADDAMRAALEARRTAAVNGLPENVAQREALTKAADESRQAAQKLIDLGFQDIQRDIDAAMKVANAGHNSGDLWWSVGEKIRAARQAVGDRAKIWYDQADQAAGGHLPNAEGLPVIAKDFMDSLPVEFKSKYPDLVRKLEDLAGKTGPDGEVIKEAAHPTFGQLHNIRSQFRNNVNYYDLTPDVRDGTYKFFANKVDNVLHDPRAVPELQTAAQLLDATDKWYGDMIRPFKDKSLQAVVDGLKADMPADPKMLYGTLVKEGRSELTNKVKEMVGPNLWAGVKAADVQEMLDMSKTLVPGQIDGRAFARQVLDRHRTGMLQSVHGTETANKLLTQAQHIAALEGRLDIKALPGDTVTEVIARARTAAEAIKTKSGKDPLGLLKEEMKKINIEHSREVAQMQKNRNNDPLGFLYKPTTGASEAVDKILAKEDLILAAAARFGEKSPEFNLLRQVYAQRILQGTLEPGKKLANVSPEIQMIMFPGISLNQMQTLAKEMDFLMGASGLNKGTAQGMSAMSKVENPWGTLGSQKNVLTGTLKSAASVLPGSGPAARAALTKYYAAITSIMTSPATLRYIERGVTGTPEERAAVGKLLSKVLQRGSAVGAGAGEAAYQRGGDQ